MKHDEKHSELMCFCRLNKGNNSMDNINHEHEVGVIEDTRGFTRK